MDRIKSNLVPFHICFWEIGYAGVFFFFFFFFFQSHNSNNVRSSSGCFYNRHDNVPPEIQ